MSKRMCLQIFSQTQLWTTLNFDPFPHSLSKTTSMFCVYGNILQDLGPKSNAASDCLANFGEVAFSFEVLWERHRHFSPVLFAFLVYLGSERVLEGILIAKAATSAFANPISHLENNSTHILSCLLIPTRSSPVLWDGECPPTCTPPNTELLVFHRAILEE